MILKQHQLWLDSRRRLLKQVKRQVNSYLRTSPEEFSTYAKPYRRELAGEWQSSSSRELQKHLRQARVVLAGDFHGYAQSQRAHLRILRDLPAHRRVVVAFECFETRHQKWLDQYVAGQLDEKKFLKKIQWQKHWQFPWPHYRPLVELARKRRYKIVGLNKFDPEASIASLQRRDFFAAEQVSQLAAAFDDHLIFVVFGNLHLGHLPKLIAQHKVVGRGEISLIFQNSEEIYFNLAERNLENTVEVLRDGPNKFCIIDSPPWVKWQNYLMLLEHIFDHDFEESSGDLELTDLVQSFVTTLARDFNCAGRFNDLQVFSSQALGVTAQLKQQLGKREMNLALKLMEADKSLFVPQGGVFYLSRLSVNHAASLAGQYVHAKLAIREQVYWNFPRDFLRQIWIEAIGFFCSKLINPKRKAESLEQIRRQVTSLPNASQAREVLLLTLDQHMREVILNDTKRLRPLRFRPRQMVSYLLAARLLGSMMGERLFVLWRSGGLRHPRVRELMQISLARRDFEAFYYTLVRLLQKKKWDRKTRVLGAQ